MYTATSTDGRTARGEDPTDAMLELAKLLALKPGLLYLEPIVGQSATGRYSINAIGAGIIGNVTRNA